MCSAPEPKLKYGPDGKLSEPAGGRFGKKTRQPDFNQEVQDAMQKAMQKGRVRLDVLTKKALPEIKPTGVPDLKNLMGFLVRPRGG